MQEMALELTSGFTSKSSIHLVSRVKPTAFLSQACATLEASRRSRPYASLLQKPPEVSFASSHMAISRSLDRAQLTVELQQLQPDFTSLHKSFSISLEHTKARTPSGTLGPSQHGKAIREVTETKSAES